MAEAEPSPRPDQAPLLGVAPAKAAVDGSLPTLYAHLHAIATRLMANERAGHTLQTTAVVHEAYLRLAEQRVISPEDRAHFFAAAAETMRRVLVDHARMCATRKRGGSSGASASPQRVTLSAANEPGTRGDVADLLALDDAVSELAKVYPRCARVVTLRFFAGLSVSEVSEVLGVAERTVKGDWALAKAWLGRAMSGGEPPASRDVTPS